MVIEICTLARMCAHACTHAQMYKHACTHTHTVDMISPLALMYPSARRHARTHARLHMHTHTHIVLLTICNLTITNEPLDTWPLTTDHLFGSRAVEYALASLDATMTKWHNTSSSSTWRRQGGATWWTAQVPKECRCLGMSLCYCWEGSSGCWFVRASTSMRQRKRKFP